MSVEALNAVRAHRFGSASLKVLMYVLADYAAADWSSYPSQARLAGETELGERTVRRLLAQAEEAGLIARETRYKGSRARHSDRILLVREAIEALPASMAARAYRPTTTPLPATDDTATHDPTGQALAGNPYVNQTEPSRAGARGGSPRRVGDLLPPALLTGARS